MGVPIVVVAYNRPKSLKRILDSLDRAEYPNSDIDLIISIDRATDNKNVLEVADKFVWQFGTKKIIYQDVNLGLKKHILKCGQLSLAYGSVIVLEDDLYVAPNFYNYTCAALKFSLEKKYIGGVSLYNHQLNVHTMDNFCANEDGYDNWYFQFASSWGQAWSKDQWMGFSNWLDTNPDISKNENIPSYVRSWSEKSWLKYNIAYLIEKDIYFMYPKISLTTNFSDAGTHVGANSTVFQVPLLTTNNIEYTFSGLSTSQSIYDAFYENKLLYKKLNLPEETLTVDLYGYKSNLNTQYVLSTKPLNFKIKNSYGRLLKPVDMNILYNVEGDDIFLYDTTIPSKNNFNKKNLNRFSYNVKHISYKNVITLFFTMTISKFKRIIPKIMSIKK